MFNPTRDQARDFFFNAWRKYRQPQTVPEPLTALERIAVEIIAQHPEYHALLENREKYRTTDYTPEYGQTNPFLHLGLHMALHEQLSIDQPPGIRTIHEELSKKLDSIHDAQHEMLDCLAETIWQAQRNGTQPDTALYEHCLRRKLE